MPRSDYHICPACNRRKAIEAALYFGKNMIRVSGLRCTAPPSKTKPRCQAESINGVVVRLPTETGRRMWRTDPQARAAIAKAAQREIKKTQKEVRIFADRAETRITTLETLVSKLRK